MSGHFPVLRVKVEDSIFEAVYISNVVELFTGTEQVVSEKTHEYEVAIYME